MVTYTYVDIFDGMYCHQSSASHVLSDYDPHISQLYFFSLSTAAKVAAVALGYSKHHWDDHILPVGGGDKFYDELSEEQKDAAAVLGYYDKVSWDGIAQEGV